MGRKRPEKGRRRGEGRKTSAPRDQRRHDATQSRAVVAGANMSGPSRLLLTRVVREGAIWDVYVATIPQSGARNLTQLEFEGTGPAREKLRHTRPVEGALLDALHRGEPVSRASLEEELDLAFGKAGAAGGATSPTVDAEPSDPGEDRPSDGR